MIHEDRSKSMFLSNESRAIYEGIIEHVLENAIPIILSDTDVKRYIEIAIAGTTWNTFGGEKKVANNEISTMLKSKKSPDKTVVMNLVSFKDVNGKPVVLYHLVPRNSNTHDNIYMYRSINQYGFTEDTKKELFLLPKDVNHALKKYESV